MDINKIIDLVAEVAVRRTHPKKRENSEKTDSQADVISLLQALGSLQAFCEPGILRPC